MREIARQLGGAPSTISRELQRNAAVGTGRPEYRASTAQTHADRRAPRPQPAKLAVNPSSRSSSPRRSLPSPPTLDSSNRCQGGAWRARRGRGERAAADRAG
ncbi:MAG: helix-turn-helix domain-containing protein [Solirubrobacterales bacterium]|nr:helix-turn-helix domain-containing protein [Solirubrobacterales bacterium]